MNQTAPIVHDDPIAGNVHEAMEAEGHARNAFRCPEDLTIFTAHNYSEPSLLERNLRYLGISNFHVINRPVKVWSNSLRIRWFVDYLERQCRTPYVLYCDANDVVLRGSPQLVLDLFHEADCDLWFGSTNWRNGYDCMPQVLQWCEKQHPGRYLNGGVFIGRPKAAIEVYRRVLEYVTDDDTQGNDDSQEFYRDELRYAKDFPRGVGCDQAILRYLEPEFFPRLRIDADSRMVFRN
jgi:hypothetical protein